tara:strand:+ start:320 stop:592 length:273 start_codon:yes stop_codon:yes gene_type:complete
MSSNYKFAVRAIVRGKKKRIKHVDTLAEAETWIDRNLLGLGAMSVLARTPLEKKQGRMEKDGPVIDVWEARDFLCTGGPFRILIVRTEDM